VGGVSNVGQGADEISRSRNNSKSIKLIPVVKVTIRSTASIEPLFISLPEYEHEN
jgi:hypothetical protein